MGPGRSCPTIFFFGGLKHGAPQLFEQVLNEVPRQYSIPSINLSLARVKLIFPFLEKKKKENLPPYQKLDQH